ncbi:hypothetical protein BO221_30255 [Archangium sp. Cb G35]|uniref:hypothetical protein n=1 Tax=Archangium sp. Cb G35 TaxID=1920190 RepID=UPI00093670B6|nr:hypothetical protein [Archangium sp. Cb G35]OJT20656.1 hypothetical protein BO221_30255 [Archangium sp. Cb G35]
MSRHHRQEPALYRRPRLLALPLVLLCVLAYLGSAAHFVLVQHAACLEHGDMVHEASGEQGEARLAVRESFEDERITRTDAQVSVHGADAHCAHVFLRRVVQFPAGVMLPPEAPVLPGQVLEVVSVAVEPQVAWLHLAPKSSPPRV